MRRVVVLMLSVVIATSACSGRSVDGDSVPELPEASTAEIVARLETSTLPTVLNVWASWCIPCRSEAPLLEKAAEEYSDRIDFVGLNVRDGQSGARSFIAEFFPTAPIEHLLDRAGDIPIDLGGSRGVPLTFFFAPGGDLIHLQTGVIDERTLALQIDELLAR